MERDDRNLGDPGGSWTTEVSGASTQGKRMVCHRRGNPETEVGRTLNADEQTHAEMGQVGNPDRKGEGKPRVARESDQLIVL